MFVDVNYPKLLGSIGFMQVLSATYCFRSGPSMIVDVKSVGFLNVCRCQRPHASRTDLLHTGPVGHLLFPIEFFNVCRCLPCVVPRCLSMSTIQSFSDRLARISAAGHLLFPIEFPSVCQCQTCGGKSENDFLPRSQLPRVLHNQAAGSLGSTPPSCSSRSAKDAGSCLLGTARRLASRDQASTQDVAKLDREYFSGSFEHLAVLVAPRHWRRASP